MRHILLLCGLLPLVTGCASGFKDVDQDGYTFDGGDCLDSDESVHPGAVELANDRDDDCDGISDEGTAAYDDDGDLQTEAEGDCDDGDPAVYQRAVEVVDGKDQDCDGVVDDHTEAYDDDQDGYTEVAGDCDDDNVWVMPAGVEICGDGVDQDCTGLADDQDLDGDGWVGSACGGEDCDDLDADAFPKHGVCTDRIDEDVLEQITETGSAEVCLLLTDNDQTLATPTSGDRAAAIAQQQEAVLEAMGAAGFAVTEQFTFLNAVCGVVTLEGAEAVALDDAVVRMHLPRSLAPVMEEAGELVHLEEAQDLGWTGAGVAVAVIDGGIDANQPVFGTCSGGIGAAGCKVVAGYDFVEDESATTGDGPDESNTPGSGTAWWPPQTELPGHGTHVAAIIAGEEEFGFPGGVAPEADLVVLRVLDSALTTEDPEIELRLAKAADWLLREVSVGNPHNIRVANISLAILDPDRSSCGDDSLAVRAVAALSRGGILPVVAAGNDASEEMIAEPACADSALAVGAVYDADGPADLYSYDGEFLCAGDDQGHDYASEAGRIACFSNRSADLDLLAPSAFFDLTWDKFRDGVSPYDVSVAGTSLSAAMVSGAAALIWGVWPDATVTDVRTELESSGASVVDGRSGLTFPLLDLAVSLSDDDDGDGYRAESYGGTDCDDTNPDINPGVVDTFNGLDDDCSGEIDSDSSLWPEDAVVAWYRDSAYMFVLRDYRWSDARSFCAGEYPGSEFDSAYHMVVLNDDDETVYVHGLADLYASELWIGLNDQDVEDTFVWEADGTEPTFPLDEPDAPVTDRSVHPYEGGEPNDKLGEDCVEIRNGAWNDEDCSDTHLFICEAGDGR